MRILALALLLSACSSVTPGPVVCPPITQYDAKFQVDASKQLSSLSGTPVYRMIEDYLTLRDVIRACEAK